LLPKIASYPAEKLRVSANPMRTMLTIETPFVSLTAWVAPWLA
jgi:hypothetical protein